MFQALLCPSSGAREYYIILYNIIYIIYLFVIMVWLINGAPDSLIADTTVSARVE